MIPYYLLLLCPAIVRIFQERFDIRIKTSSYEYTRCTDRKREKKACIGVFFFLFIMLLACRAITCGIDLAIYRIHFENCAASTWREILNNYKGEYLYYFLNKGVSLINNDFHFFITIIAVLSVLPIWYLYKHESRSPYLSVSLFIAIAPFSMYFSGLRQVVAMAFVVPAFYFAKNRKLIPFILTVILALFFHSSAFVLALLYPIYSAKITKKWLWFVIPSMVLMFVFNKLIFNTIIGYLSVMYQERYGDISSTGSYGTLMILVIFSIVAIILPDEEKLKTDGIALRNILLLCTCIQFFAPINRIAMRMNFYYLPIVPLAIARVINCSKDKYYQIANMIRIVFIVAFIALFFYRAIGGDDVYNIYPYVAFWNEY